MEEFNIHEITSIDASAILFIKETMASLECRPGLEDVECFLASDHPGIYIGELNGTPIGSVSFTKYCSTYYSFGLYLVEEIYRGKGYGMQIFNTAIKEIDSSQNISAYAVPSIAKKYEIHGFRTQWLCSNYDINLTKALEFLKAIPSNQNGLTAKSTTEIDQEALLSYDTAVFGYQRNSFLMKWLHAKGSHVKVVVNSERTIVGYAAARVAYLQHEGYRLGPLFADSDEAAKVLLKALFEEILCNGISTSHSVTIFCLKRNSNSMELMEQLHGKHTFDLAYITTKGVPNGCFDKWFGITSPEIG
ncbi:uncharacterized protein LOC114574812 [Exaiptasia diaphana]|uniref:N-acetyltransferase domain-containing protein n=1 Tax=Exaiptasia diaphana TaxID=2652724 RepID=A0A913YGP6_EXADI|nr:uncharacterized protein LOC114574812 [Exaiptasia diaphana]